MSNPDYDRYDELYDETFKSWVSDYFNGPYNKGWYLSEIVRMPSGKWLIKWEKDLAPLPPEPTKQRGEK